MPSGRAASRNCLKVSIMARPPVRLSARVTSNRSPKALIVVVEHPDRLPGRSAGGEKPFSRSPDGSRRSISHKGKIVVGQGRRCGEDRFSLHDPVVMTGTGNDVLPGDDLGQLQFHPAVLLVHQAGEDLGLGVQGAVHRGDDDLPEFPVEKEPQGQQDAGGAGNLPEEEPAGQGAGEKVTIPLSGDTRRPAPYG